MLGWVRYALAWYREGMREARALPPVVCESRVRFVAHGIGRAVGRRVRIHVARVDRGAGIARGKMSDAAPGVRAG